MPVKTKKKSKVKKSGNLVFCLSWSESERGWGQKPYGYSLHLTPEDAKKYIADHWKREKSLHDGDGVPDIYVRPDSDTPYPCRVGSKKFEALQKNKRKHGVRFYDNNAPKRA